MGDACRFTVLTLKGLGGDLAKMAPFTLTFPGKTSLFEGKYIRLHRWS